MFVIITGILSLKKLPINDNLLHSISTLHFVKTLFKVLSYLISSTKLQPTIISCGNVLDDYIYSDIIWLVNDFHSLSSHSLKIGGYWNSHLLMGLKIISTVLPSLPPMLSFSLSLPSTFLPFLSPYSRYSTDSTYLEAPSTWNMSRAHSFHQVALNRSQGSFPSQASEEPLLPKKAVTFPFYPFTLIFQMSIFSYKLD